MITRLSIFNITLSFCLLNPIFAQDEDEQVWGEFIAGLIHCL